MIRLNIMLGMLMENLLYVVYPAILHKLQGSIGYQQFLPNEEKGMVEPCKNIDGGTVRNKQPFISFGEYLWQCYRQQESSQQG